MGQSFANQVAVITGASSGIGWALAKELAGQGAKVGLVARRKDKLDLLAEEIRQAGGTAAVAAADVGCREQVLPAVAAVVAQLGPIDLMVANAGIGGPTTLEPMNTQTIERVLQVNVLGVVYSIEAVLGDMLKRGQGHIAAVSSLAAYKGFPGESAYCASKAAVNSYLEGLRLHLRYQNIAVTTICPGFIRTPITDVNPFPMPFLMDADKAARKIARALYRRKKVYNFPWRLWFLVEMTRWLPDWLVYLNCRRYLNNPPKFPEEMLR